MKHAQRTEKYIRLIFNSYISDDDFFQKSMRIIDTNCFFSGDVQGQEGVCIMHQCALCNPKYGIHKSVIKTPDLNPHLKFYSEWGKCCNFAPLNIVLKF